MAEPTLNTRHVQLGDSAHSAFQRGIAQIVNAVRPTLGPLPRVVAIDRPAPGLTPELLDSGAVIARRITEIADRRADPGAMYLRGLLWRIHEEVGDGAATAAVVFDTVYREGRRAIAAGIAPQRLRTQLEQGADVIAATLGQFACPITDDAIVAQLSRSVTHDTELADLIADAIEIAGAYGPIDIRDAHGMASRYELVEGAYWESGLLSDALLDGHPAQRLELTDTVVLLTDLDLAEPASLIPVLEYASQTNSGGVLVTGRSLSPGVVALLVANSRRLGLPIAVVNVPGLGGADRHAALDDLEIITGGRALRVASGDRLDRLKTKHVGRIRRGWATRTQFGIAGGCGESKALRRHLAALTSQLDRTSNPDNRVSILNRLGKFHRGSVTLYVGAATEAEQKLKRSIAERAINVLRRSLSSGVVPGGGASLIHCRSTVDRHFAGDGPEARWARRILLAALETPAGTIAKNAGYEPSPIVARLCANPHLVFNAVSGAMESRFSSDITDPVFVVCESATRAIRSAALALTIDAIVHTGRSEISVEPG